MNEFKILLVDDSRTIHEEIKHALSNILIDGTRLEFAHAYGYEEFKKIYEPEKFALVLTDLVMEEEDSGIKVINHIRHECNDHKTRVALMTANPEKVPGEMLVHDYDVNLYLEKRSLSSLTLKVSVASLLRTYKDIVSFERALNSVESVFSKSLLLDYQALLPEIFYQVRSLLSLRMPNLRLEGCFVANDESLFETPGYREALSKGSAYRYEYSARVGGNDVRFFLLSSKSFSDLEESYVRAILSNLEKATSFAQLQKIEDEVVFRLSNLIEARSEETGNHVKRVAEVSHILAVEYGFDENAALKLRAASSLHDVGKIAIPDYILKKPGRLDEREFAIMKEHTLIGFELLRNSNLPIFELGALVALQHHERWDGEGYPYGLKAEEIAPEARVVQVADVFEALTHKRCYRPAWPLKDVIEYMLSMSGKQFDPRLIEILMKRLREILAIFDELQD